MSGDDLPPIDYDAMRAELAAQEAESDERNADVMKADAEMDALIGGARDYMLLAEAKVRKVEKINEEYDQLLNELFATGAAVRALLFAGRGALEVDTAAGLCPDPPDASGTEEEWDTFCSEMERTEAPFKQMMKSASIDAIKASPEWVALTDKQAALRARIDELRAEDADVLAELNELES